MTRSTSPTYAVISPEPVSIILLGEPVAAGRPRFTKAGTVYMPTKTRHEIGTIRLVAQQQMQGRLPFEGALTVDYVVERRIPKMSKRRHQQALDGIILPITRPDADNYLKCLDALDKVVWRDDAQICQLSFLKRYSAQPKTVITIRPLARLPPLGQ